MLNILLHMWRRILTVPPIQDDDDFWPRLRNYPYGPTDA